MITSIATPQMLGVLEMLTQYVVFPVSTNVGFRAATQCPLLALNSCRERKMTGDREATSVEVGHAPV